MSSCVVFAFATHCVARGIVLPAIIADFGLTFTQSGVIFGSATVAYFLMSSMSGKLSEWFGQRVSLSIYIGALSLCGLLMAFMGSVPALTALFIIAGFCYGGIDATLTSLVSRYHGEKASPALTRVFSIYCLGGMLSAIMSGSFIYYGIGWRAAFLAIAMACFLAFAVSILIKDSGPSASPPIELSQLGRLIKNKPFMLCCIAAAISSGAETASINWMTTFFTSGMSMDILHSALCSAMFFLSLFIGRTFIIGFLKRYDAQIIVMLASLTSGLLIMVVSFVSTPDLMLAAMIIFGLSVSCVNPLMISTTIKFSDENLRFSFMYAMISISNFGVMSATGVIADMAGMPSVFRVNGFLFILAPVLIWISRKQCSASC
jgi:FHS family glucose/mannose:H+ symporter-like MFS transporter